MMNKLWLIVAIFTMIVVTNQTNAQAYEVPKEIEKFIMFGKCLENTGTEKGDVFEETTTNQKNTEQITTGQTTRKQIPTEQMTTKQTTNAPIVTTTKKSNKSAERKTQGSKMKNNNADKSRNSKRGRVVNRSNTARRPKTTRRAKNKHPTIQNNSCCLTQGFNSPQNNC
ncbi:hypothetical protein KSF78_0007220 [Schistosoma japonicum]|nr:hypothetical protein KSF78_0007219 [Schistosoma japonicum]KAH8860452.1 hypothetical protein KSF78_0007220 [Schistosoma japonicum]